MLENGNSIASVNRRHGTDGTPPERDMNRLRAINILLLRSKG
jgi:hypothetical protein